MPREDIVVQHDESSPNWVSAHPEITTVVTKGHPVAQAYGQGGYNKAWGEDICGKGSPCAIMEEDEKVAFYAVGAPYIIHIDDLHPVAANWQKFMKPVFEKDKEDIQADMYAYEMAAASLPLPHLRVQHMMVSSTEDGNPARTEGWSLIDGWDEMSCREPKTPPGKRVPTVLHYCSGYEAKDIRGNLWLWHKGHVPHDILSCSTGLLKPPPDDLYNTQDDLEGRRNAWMLCQLFYHVNNAVSAYKVNHCQTGDVNLRKTIRILPNDAPHTVKCSDSAGDVLGGVPDTTGKHPPCYPYAQREPEGEDHMIQRPPMADQDDNGADDDNDNGNSGHDADQDDDSDDSNYHGDDGDNSKGENQDGDKTTTADLFFSHT